MLFTLYPLITQNYLILSFCICLGILQWSAARYNRPSISVLGPWGMGRVGMTAGGLLILGGFTWFFSCTPGLLDPGLAGGELSSLFGLGGVLALLLARLAGGLWR